ncbi:maleylpyruvate isomerase family mycothiol-dependent enzyme [Longispora albida]|uniref:maleylpyruvate isomerase family mycothiol-dependent enzyme n=1 Tax=Longispora albida TaxID=203523 RepID=UPI00036472F1|nr:maleylpyruvate isomerase family mycothiol-dependent enzyme [Longispora albida]
MTSDPLALLSDLDRATARLLRTVGGLTDADVAAPSLLPGWSRGHVLAHIARNADGLGNLLTWASSGVETPMYPGGSPQRDADIEAGAPRPAAEQLADVKASSERFAELADGVPADGWGVMVWGRDGKPFPAATAVWKRLKEVEIHHLDLAAGYGAPDWPEAFTLRLLRESAHDFGVRRDAPRMVLNATDLGAQFAAGDGEGAPVISGPGHALAEWVIGRGVPKALTGQQLPALPSWG